VKLSVIVIIIFALLTSTLSKLYIYTDYIINIDSITEKYCVNKSKAELKCKGKCHISKQISEQDKNEEKSNNKLKEINDVQLFCNFIVIVPNKFSSTLINHLGFIKNFILFDFKRLIFHPPIYSV
jgi:hypothetical protein